MNRTEMVKVCDIIAELCPTQKFSDFTPDAWHIVLNDVRYEDAQQAIRTIYRDHGNDQEWNRKIEADDILREVRRIREKRIADHPELIPPAGLTVLEDIAWRRDALRRIGNGETITDTRGELKPRPTLGILAGHRMDET